MCVRVKTICETELVLFSLSRVLTRVPHMATTAGDEATVEHMLKRWQDKDTGLDAAWREDYRVYLSFPDKDKPNTVTVGESCPRERRGGSSHPTYGSWRYAGNRSVSAVRLQAYNQPHHLCDESAVTTRTTLEPEEEEKQPTACHVFMLSSLHFKTWLHESLQMSHYYGNESTSEQTHFGLNPALMPAPCC